VSRTLKAWALALGLIGLLLVVALAARGGHPTRGGHVSTRSVPASLQDSLVTLIAIVYVLALAAIVVLFFHRRPWQAPPESRWLRKFVTVVALMIIATVLGFWASRHGNFWQGKEKLEARIGQKQRPGAGLPLQPVPARQAKFQWPLALGLGGLLILGGAVLIVLERRGRPGAKEGETIADDLVRAVETTIEDLRSEQDPRRAVIAAYANMERVLARHGFARRSAEAPFEFLARILRDLDVREGAVQSLTRLFEYAKFSAHEIDTAMKDEAIEALIAVRDDLQAEERAAA
jgi:hypothetical protein